MQARIVQRHYGVAEGEIYPRWYEVDSIVEGQIAEAALATGNAVPLDTMKSDLEPSSASQPDQASPQRTVKKRRGRPPKSSA